MPELPDIEYFRSKIDKTIGKKIMDYTIHEKDLVKVSRKKLNEIREHKINSTRRRGKYCFVEVDQFDWFVFHFGMTGDVFYNHSDEEKPDYPVLSLFFKDNDSLIITSKRKLGKIELAKSPRLYSENNGIGPDVLDLDQQTFLDLLDRKKGMIKTALMDQSVFSGIGNIYSDEILFQSRLFPEKDLSELDEKQKKSVYTATREVLRKAIRVNAQPDKLPEHFIIPHRKEGEKCPVCSGKIKKITISGRGSYYCPSCQKK